MEWTSCQKSGSKSSRISTSGLLHHPLLVKRVLFIGLSPRQAPSSQTWFTSQFQREACDGALSRDAARDFYWRYWHIISSTVTELAKWKIVPLQPQWRKSRTKEGQKNGDLDMVILEASFMSWLFLFYDPANFLLTPSSLTYCITSIWKGLYLYIQLVLIIHGFCICKLVYLLIFICDPGINGHGAILVICGHAKNEEKFLTLCACSQLKSNKVTFCLLVSALIL